MAGVKSSVEPVFIDLRDGKKHGLVYGTKAIAEMERQNGYRTFIMLLGQNYGFAGAQSFIWAGLRHEQKPNFSMDDAADLIDHYMQQGGSLYELLPHISEALIRAGVLRRLEAEKTNGVDSDPPVQGAQTGAPLDSMNGGTYSNPSSADGTD